MVSEKENCELKTVPDGEEASEFIPSRGLDSAQHGEAAKVGKQESNFPGATVMKYGKVGAWKQQKRVVAQLQRLAVCRREVRRKALQGCSSSVLCSDNIRPASS